jgi:hypothetical protein
MIMLLMLLYAFSSDIARVISSSITTEKERSSNHSFTTAIPDLQRNTMFSLGLKK